jgi:glycosyltransferase involved in cell wall biosynthesis
MRIAYIVGRLPSLTETFVADEILALKDWGVDVDTFVLRRGKPTIVHKSVESLSRDAHYARLSSATVWQANWRELRRGPAKYLRTLAASIVRNGKNTSYMVAALYTFPVAVYFAEKIRESSRDHVHAHFAHHPGLAAWIVHRLTGVPFSFTVHGHDLHLNPAMIETKVADAADVFTVSEYNRGLLVERCGREYATKIHVLHCGIANADRLHSRSSGPRRLQIVSVGSLLEVKGHEYLIAACAELRNSGTEFNCIIIGEGPRRRALERLIGDLHLGDCVRLVGAKEHSQVLSILADSDIAVQPSIFARNGSREGIPVALMEAMSCGLPVVASELSGIPELVHDGVSGILVQPGRVLPLASAIARLAHDSRLRAEMGAAGREIVMRDFNLHTNSRSLIEFFQSRQRAGQEAAA